MTESYERSSQCPAIPLVSAPCSTERWGRSREWLTSTRRATPGMQRVKLRRMIQIRSQDSGQLAMVQRGVGLTSDLGRG